VIRGLPRKRHRFEINNRRIRLDTQRTPRFRITRDLPGTHDCCGTCDLVHRHPRLGNHNTGRVAHLARRGLDPDGRTIRELLERSPDESTRACVRALADLERIRFGPAGAADDADARLDAVRALLERAERT